MEKQKLTYSLIGKKPRSFDFLLYGLLTILVIFNENKGITDCPL